ncbi:hypothetical protein GCM10009663_21880 [Kitasatospora arboriphila]|uniref:Uncharacterized protein n=1 Tax=Kitasatospora arboriphila TaxID=258052 RepID=A0ABP4DY67_9ACTN
MQDDGREGPWCHAEQANPARRFLTGVCQSPARIRQYRVARTWQDRVARTRQDRAAPGRRSRPGAGRATPPVGG